MTTNNTQPPEPDHLRLIVRDEVSRLIRHHATLCAFSVDEHPRRLRNVEASYARLTGFMLGSGLLGGTAGAAIAKYLT